MGHHLVCPSGISSRCAKFLLEIHWFTAPVMPKRPLPGSCLATRSHFPGSKWPSFLKVNSLAFHGVNFNWNNWNQLEHVQGSGMPLIIRKKAETMTHILGLEFRRIAQNLFTTRTFWPNRLALQQGPTGPEQLHKSKGVKEPGAVAGTPGPALPVCSVAPETASNWWNDRCFDLK